jgi:hypothetical protein
MCHMLRIVKYFSVEINFTTNISISKLSVKSSGSVSLYLQSAFDCFNDNWGRLYRIRPISNTAAPMMKDVLNSAP